MISSKIFVRVLILNWNHKNILLECVDSIKKSDYSNYSITVIDNGSSDSSVNYILSKHKDVDFIQISKNLGYSKGYNYAFKRLKPKDNEWYLLLNNDTIIQHDTISSLVQNSFCYGDSHIYSPKILNIKNNKIWYAGGKQNRLTGNLYHRGINKNNNIITSYKSGETDFISGCCMFINSNLVNTLDGFDTKYSYYYEDVDLCLRAKKIGKKCFYISDSYVLHHISYSLGGRFSLIKIYNKIISFIKFLYFNNSSPIFIFYIFINIIIFPINMLNMLIKKLF